jgi:hypothetical protein
MEEHFSNLTENVINDDVNRKFCNKYGMEYNQFIQMSLYYISKLNKQNILNTHKEFMVKFCKKHNLKDINIEKQCLEYYEFEKEKVVDKIKNIIEDYFKGPLLDVPWPPGYCRPTLSEEIKRKMEI